MMDNVRLLATTTMRIYLQIVIMVTLLLATEAGAREEAEEKYSKTAGKAAKIKRGKVLAELKKLGAHDWAGDYYAGDGLGVNTSLMVAPNSGYLFEWHGCGGLYDRNCGTVVWTNGRAQLSFTFQNTREGFQGIAPELVLVPWGARRYLVPADDIVGFCYDINEGREPRIGAHGFYLLRRGDEDKKVNVLPKLPDEYRHYLLAEPVEATILAVGPPTTRPNVVDGKFMDMPVTIDAGKEQSLRVGMKLFVTKPPGLMRSFRVTKVNDNRAEAIMIHAGEVVQPGDPVGYRLSTHAPWNVRETK